MKKYVLVLLLGLLACTGTSQNGEPDKYFKGSEGVDMRLPDRSSPPGELYYYDNGDNTFDVSLEVWNKGSSAARGGVYLSGYDPHMIKFPTINPNKNARACGFRLSNIASGLFGFSVGCGQDRISYQEDSGWSVQLDQTLDFLAQEMGLDPQRYGSEFKANIHKGDWNFEFDFANIDIEYYKRGKLMLAAFAPVNFERNGEEYVLRGDTPAYPGGDVRIVDWQGEVTNFPPGLDKARQNFLITNCYLYSTHAAPVVCIDPNPRSKSEKSCSATRYGGGQGQGAPVAVTRIEQENTRRHAVFHIDIKNIGGGEVWHPGKVEKCNPYNPARVSLQDKNKVMLGMVRVSGDPTPLDCVPERVIRLDRRTGKGEITCRYPVPFQGLKSAYQTPLVVELWYGYEDTIKRTMTVRRDL